MVGNAACMREIIEFVSNNIIVSVEDDNKFYIETTNLYKIIEHLSAKGYGKETIISNFLLCCKYHYLESNTFSNDLSMPTSFIDCKVTDVTIQGLQLLKK